MERKDKGSQEKIDRKGHLGGGRIDRLSQRCGPGNNYRDREGQLGTGRCDVFRKISGVDLKSQCKELEMEAYSVKKINLSVPKAIATTAMTVGEDGNIY